MSSASYEEGLAHKHQLSNNSVPQTKPIVKREDNVEIKPDGKSSEIAVGLIVDGWGENGRVSFNSSFDAEVNDNGFRGTKAEYMRNYNRFYIQGLNGGKISNVPSQYADRISMSARKAAYEAGVADRNASLDAKYKARNEVVVKDGGLIRNHNTENISAEMSDVLERLGKMFGVTVEIQDKVIGDDGKEKNGLISNGEVKLSYDKMVKSGNIERVAEFIINHEIAHRVQELAPKDYQKFRDIALEVAIEGDKARYINDYAKERNLTYDEAIDEIVCDMVGKEGFATELALQQPNLAERIKNWIKDILDTLGLRKYTNGERLLRTWENACNQAQKQVEINRKNPKMQKSNGVEKYSEGKDTRYDYSKTFEEQIDDYLKGDFPQNDTFIVGKTDDVYLKIGFNPLPITIAQGHIKTALDKNSDADHYLGKQKLKQLPAVIGKPIAIIRSKTHPDRVVALLPFKQNGKTVITPFEVDGLGVMNNDGINSNALTTVFGKGNILDQLSDALISEQNGNVELFYWNKKEALSLLQARGLQLPNSLPQDGFIHSIHEKGANINTKFKNVTETQQFKRWFGKSKVVNDNGTPKVVYHGTNEKFNVFDLKKSGKNYPGISDGFFFFTNKKSAYPNSASDYAMEATKKNGGSETIYECYLSIKRPLYLDSNGYYDTVTYFDNNAEEIYEKYFSGDYDGVIIRNSDKSVDDGELYLVDDSTQIKSATDNIGTFDGKNPDVRYSEGDIDELFQVRRERDEAIRKAEYYKSQLKRTKPFTPNEKSIKSLVKKLAKDYDGGKIQKGMSDEKRSAILSQKRINVPQINEDKMEVLAKFELSALRNAYIKQAVPILKKISEQFGVTEKIYRNDNIELEFLYSNSSLKESIHKQKASYNEFAKMLSVFDDVIQSAVGIEVHEDKYKGTLRENTSLKSMYVLISAFYDGNNIIPVQLEVKEYADRPNKLYMTVALNKERNHGLGGSLDENHQLHAAHLVSEISITELVKTVNPFEGDFLKYFPDEMLSDEQIKGKREALEKEKKRIDEQHNGTVLLCFFCIQKYNPIKKQVV